MAGRSVARQMGRRWGRIPSGPTRGASTGVRVVTPDEVPEHRTEDNRSKGNKKAEYLINPIHSVCPVQRREDRVCRAAGNTGTFIIA
jgi:hypothetical protein